MHVMLRLEEDADRKAIEKSLILATHLTVNIRVSLKQG